MHLITAFATRRRISVYMPLTLLLLGFMVRGNAQTAPAVAPRITAAIDETMLTRLAGNTHPLARAEFDQGAAPPDLPMERMLLVLKRAPEQEAALQGLLQDQQDKSSPNYHRWLTPDQFGQQFGPADQDIETITSWLQSHGLRVARVGRGRAVLEFSGSAAQVRDAFHTEIHNYVAGGEQHWANASDPQIPAALMSAVSGVVSLHNFTSRPLHHVAGPFSREQATGTVRPILSQATPQFTFTSSQCSPACYAVTPFDFAQIYDVQPLWNAGFDGSGQKIAIIGRSNIDIRDVRAFRNLFGLPANDPTIVLDGQDPTAVLGDETESDLDVEWSGAVAPRAAITFISSADTNSADGISLSALYAVDNNIAPVLSVSYGSCELDMGTSGNQFYKGLWEQAAAQGITVVVAAGDSGSAGCDFFDGNTPEPALGGLAVNGLASTPFNVAVGGTDLMNFGPTFNVNSPSPYWNTANNGQLGSVKGYVPESTWDSTCSNDGLPFLGYESTGQARCNDSRLRPFVFTGGGGGGRSNCTTSDGLNVGTCSGGHDSPPWQTTGLRDRVRDVPDVSLFASNGFLNSFYIICEADRVADVSCGVNPPVTNFVGIGGTSAAAPAFAGMMALVNQFTSTATGQGNANFVLYKLPSVVSQQGLNCNAQSPPDSRCVFNDVTFGTVAMPCAAGTPNCVVSSANDSYGVLSGYDAGAGYDLATGLGSVNAFNLAKNWSQATFNSTSTTLSLDNTSSGPVNISHGTSVQAAVTVKSSAGMPGGDVSLIANSPNGEGVDGHALSGGTANWETNQLPGGSYSVHAHYPGDGNFGASDSGSVAVNVSPETSITSLTPLTFASGGFVALPTTVPYGTMVYLRADVRSKAQPSSDTPPTGTVTYTDNYTGSQAPTPPGVVDTFPYALNSDGFTVAANGIFSLFPGVHSVSASYSGDNSYKASATPGGSPITLTITQATTQTSISSPGKSIAVGSTLVVTVTVSTNIGLNPLTGGWGGAAVPSGTVTLFSGGKQIAVDTAIGGGPIVNPVTQTGQAVGAITIPGSVLPIGHDSITAVYAGDFRYTGSTSSAITIDVGLASTTALSSSSPSVSPGTNVTFTAQVTGQSGSPAVTGSVLFQIDGSDGTSVPLGTNGTAQFTTRFASAAPNSHLITAQYSGDTNYIGSKASLAEDVLAPDFTLSDSLGSISNIVIAAPGQSSVPITLTVNGMNGYDGTIIFSPSSCVITPAGSLSSCSFNPSSLTGSGSTQLVITTTAPHAAATPTARFDLDGRKVQPIAFVILLSVILVIFKRQRRLSFSFGLAILLALFGVWACSGGSNQSSTSSATTTPGTPTGVMYTATVNAAPAGSNAHAINVPFIVQ